MAAGDEHKAYTRREVDLVIITLNEKLNSWDIKLDNIHAEVVAINGRGVANTADISNLKSWRDRMLGGLSVMTVLVVPVLIYIVQLWVR